MSDFVTQAANFPVEKIDWLADMQDRAKQNWMQLDLPNRKTENWKYTSLKNVVSQNFFSDSSNKNFSLPEKHFKN